MKILPLAESHLEKVRKFTDEQIGAGYYSPEDLKDYLSLPASSFILIDDQGEIQGVRLTLPPAELSRHQVLRKLTPALWKTPLEQTAYFQSLFIAPAYQKQGWGRQLSEKSLQVLRSLGCRAVTCHSWKESPGNSSLKYLKSIGFEEIKEHKKFWYDRNYLCTGCGQPKCLCTGIEMIRYLK